MLDQGASGGRLAGLAGDSRWPLSNACERVTQHAVANQYVYVCSGLLRRLSASKHDAELDIEVQRELGQVGARYEQTVAIGDDKFCVERAIPSVCIARS